MLKKTITYKDYNDVERTEDFYFNLNKAELIEMETGKTGGMTHYIEQISQLQDQVEMIKIMKTIVIDSYGEKSLDGKRFVKNKELKEGFQQTEAYSIIFMELATDGEKAAEFINGIMPKLGTPKQEAALKAIVDKEKTGNLNNEQTKEMIAKIFAESEKEAN